MFWMVNHTLDKNKISLASYPLMFAYGTNETASLIIHDYRHFLAKCLTVHNAA